MNVGAIAAASAIAPDPGLRMIPMENPTPMRTPGLLFNNAAPQSRACRAFVALLRRRAMGQSSLSVRPA
jgi:LysR family cyn operon transcriptional activator